MKLTPPLNKAHSKRLQEWKQWLINFQEQNLDENGKPYFAYIPNAAWILNDLYWKLAEQFVRELLVKSENEDEHKIHHYKIISISEIAVMMALPVIVPNDEKLRPTTNALLAWFIAIQILEGWNTGVSTFPVITNEIVKMAEYREYIDETNQYPVSFAVEHIKWLTYLNVIIEKPIMLNAQCCSQKR